MQDYVKYIEAEFTLIFTEPKKSQSIMTSKQTNKYAVLLRCILYRVTQKKRELLKNPTKIEEIQKKNIDRN